MKWRHTPEVAKPILRTFIYYFKLLSPFIEAIRYETGKKRFWLILYGRRLGITSFFAILIVAGAIVISLATFADSLLTLFRTADNLIEDGQTTILDFLRVENFQTLLK